MAFSIAPSANLMEQVPFLPEYGEVDPYEIALTAIESFLTATDRSPDSNNTHLENACGFLAEILTKWNQVSEKNSLKVHKIMTLMSSIERALVCVKEDDKRIYRNLLNLFVQASIVRIALCNIQTFVTGSRHINPVPPALLVTYRSVLRFAIKFFADLTEKDRELLKNTHAYTLTSREVYTEVWEKENYRALGEIFMAFNPNTKSNLPAPVANTAPAGPVPSSPKGKGVLKPSPKTPRPPSPDDFVFIEDTQGGVKLIEEQKRKAEDVKVRQANKINAFFTNVFKYYIPLVITLKPKYSDEMLVQLMGETRALFFHPPSHPTNQKKNLVLELMISVHDLLKYFNTQSLYNKEDKERTLTIQTSKLMTDAENSREALLEELRVVIMDLAKLILKDNPAVPKALYLGIGAAAVKLIEDNLTPALIAFLLDRLTKEDEKHNLKMDLDNEEGPTPPLHLYLEHANPIYTQAYGTLVMSIMELFVEFGHPTGAMKMATEALKFANKVGITRNPIPIDTNEIGQKIQAFLAKLAASECTMLPFLIAKQLLFEVDKEEVFLPLNEFLSMKPEKKKEYADKSADIFNNFILKKLIDKLGFLNQIVPSLTDFCSTICIRFWQISQSQPLMMKGLLEALKGVKRSMERKL